MRARPGVVGLVGLITGALLSGLVAVLIWPDDPQPTAITKDGLLEFRIVSIDSGIAQTTGTHAEFIPRGRLTHVRLSVINPDSSYHDYLAKDQVLRTSAGRSLTPDHDAMLVKRQADSVSIWAHGEITVELWFDVALGDSPTSLVVRDSGDGGSGTPIVL